MNELLIQQILMLIDTNIEIQQVFVFFVIVHFIHNFVLDYDELDEIWNEMK